MLTLWLATGILARSGEGPPPDPDPPPPLTGGGGTRQIGWWRGYKTFRPRREVTKDLAEEIALSLPIGTESVTQVDLASMEMVEQAFAKLSLETRAQQAALVRELVAKVNAQIREMELDDEDVVLLLS